MPMPESSLTRHYTGRCSRITDGWFRLEDAGTGFEDVVAAHAVVDPVQGGHQPAAVDVPRVECIGLPDARRAQLGEPDATLRVIAAGAVDTPEGGGGRAVQLGRVAGAGRTPDTDRGSLKRLARGEGAGAAAPRARSRDARTISQGAVVPALSPRCARPMSPGASETRR
jgi:hypothetical protein